MSAWQTPSYGRILDASKRLHRIVLNEKSEDALAIKASEVLIQLESYKAELRGKPRIKAVEWRDVPKRAARRTDAQPRIPSKGISLPADPVTAPPPGQGPESGQ